MDQFCEACSEFMETAFCPECGAETVEVGNCIECGASIGLDGEDGDVCADCAEG